MTPLKVTCNHCGHQTSLDASKVPDRPVAYKCPKCSGKIVVDKQKLLGGPPSTEMPVATSDEAPVAAIRADELELPPGETLPPGFLISEPGTPGEELAKQLEAHDSTLNRLDIDDARERASVDPPPLIVYVGGELGAPPYKPLAPILNLPPRERRQTFLLLCASDVKTLDGNLAFLYEANVLINHEHIPQAAGILYNAMRHHQRLFRPLLAALGDVD